MTKEVTRKSKKILILIAAILIVIVIGNLIRERNQPQIQNSNFQLQSLSKGFSSAEGSIITSQNSNKLLSYPPPQHFRQLELKSDQAIISDTCSDKLYAVLIFDSAIDYRQNVGGAKYNRAYPCPDNKKIDLTINTVELGIDRNKAYYYIVADENETNGWYNPR